MKGCRGFWRLWLDTRCYRRAAKCSAPFSKTPPGTSLSGFKRIEFTYYSNCFLLCKYPVLVVATLSLQKMHIHTPYIHFTLSQSCSSTHSPPPPHHRPHHNHPTFPHPLAPFEVDPNQYQMPHRSPHPRPSIYLQSGIR